MCTRQISGASTNLLPGRPKGSVFFRWVSLGILMMWRGREVGHATPCTPLDRRPTRTGAHRVTRPTNVTK